MLFLQFRNVKNKGSKSRGRAGATTQLPPKLAHAAAFGAYTLVRRELALQNSQTIPTIHIYEQSSDCRGDVSHNVNCHGSNGSPGRAICGIFLGGMSGALTSMQYIDVNCVEKGALNMMLMYVVKTIFVIQTNHKENSFVCSESRDANIPQKMGCVRERDQAHNVWETPVLKPMPSSRNK